MKLNFLFVCTLALVFVNTSCKYFQSNFSSSTSQENTDRNPKTCAAIRGNGHYLMAHFGALARISEHYGSLYAVAGGSSGAVTAFLYESIRMHPEVKKFEDAERSVRTALLLKSVMGYIKALGDSPEAQDILFVLNIIQRIRFEGLLNLPETQYQEAARRLSTILKDDKIISLVNPQVLTDLVFKNGDSTELYKFRVNEILNAIKTFGAFDASDQRIFFRSGVVSFDGLAGAMGRMADFYAGKVQSDKASLNTFISNCSPLRVQGGKTWQQVAKESTSGGTCGDLLTSAVKAYRNNFDPAVTSIKTRVDEPMGSFIPTIIPTAVLYGPEAKLAYDQATARYAMNQTPNMAIKFSDVRFGYWYPDSIAETIRQNKSNFKDKRSEKFLEISTTATWRDVLRASPAEPGLSAGVPINTNMISVGGWGDLTPVQVLKAAGCDQVVYITRRTPESPFLVSPDPIDRAKRNPKGVAELLNMEESDRLGIFNYDDKSSSYGAALSLSAAVWCTDWNRFTDVQSEEMMDEAYNAEMVVVDPKFQKVQSPYLKYPAGKVTGCTPPE